VTTVILVKDNETGEILGEFIKLSSFGVPEEVTGTEAKRITTVKIRHPRWPTPLEIPFNSMCLA